MIKTFRSSASFFNLNEPDTDINLIEVRQKLDEIIRKLLYLNNTRDFYFTGESFIDRMAHEIVSNYIVKFKDIKRIYCSTRPWNDTTCNFDKKNFNKLFERKVPIDITRYKNRQEQIIHSSKTIIDWSHFVIYYAKLNDQISFIDLKQKLLKNRVYNYLMKRRPKSAINLIDYNLEDYLKVKEFVNIKHRRKIDGITNFVVRKKTFYTHVFKYPKQEFKYSKKIVKAIRNNNLIDEDRVMKINQINYVNKEIQKERFLKQIKEYREMKEPEISAYDKAYRNFRNEYNKKYLEHKLNMQSNYFSTNLEE